MELPDILVNTSLIKEKSVFYFSSSKINSTEPHNFILIKRIDESLIVFSCCTTKYDTIYNYILRNNYPEETIASLDYNVHDFLKSPTFINCNSKTEYSYREFVDLYSKGKITYKGEITTEEYDKIVDGMILSDDIEDEIKDYLK
jgi:hypothetical protein